MTNVELEPKGIKMAAKKPKPMTAGEVADIMLKHDRNKPVLIYSYVQQYRDGGPDAGTDMSGNEEHRIVAIHDLETKLHIEIEAI